MREIRFRSMMFEVRSQGSEVRGQKNWIRNQLAKLIKGSFSTVKLCSISLIIVMLFSFSESAS